MTKKEMFAHIATVNAQDSEIVEFCNKEIERKVCCYVRNTNVTYAAICREDILCY